MGFMDALDRMVLKKSKNKFDRVNVIVMMPPGAQSMYTGAGPDGVVQPNRAAAIDYSGMPPRILHEGELVNQLPGGNRQVVPSPLTLQGMQMAQTPQQQQQMGAMPLPGHQLGGTYPNVDQFGQTYDPSKHYTQSNYDPFQVTPGKPSVVNTTMGTTSGAPPPPPPAMQPPAIPATSTKPSIYTNAQNKALGITVGVAQGTDPYARTVANRATDTYNANAGYTNTLAQSQLALNPNMTEGARNVAQADLARQANIGMSNLQGTLAENQQARMQGAAQSAFTMGGQMNETQQKEAQSAFDNALTVGDYNAAASAYKTMTGKELDTSTYQTLQQQKVAAGQQNVTGMELANEATRIANASEQDKAKWTTFMNAAEYGSDAEVSAAYEAYFGKPLTDAAFVKDIRTYAQTKRTQDIASGQISIEAARYGLDNEKLADVTNYINKGWGLAALNEAIPGLNMTQDTYDGIKADYNVRLGVEIFAAVSEAIGSGASFDSVAPLLAAKGITGQTALDTFQGMQEKLYNLPMESMRTQVGVANWQLLVDQAGMGQGVQNPDGSYGYDLNGDGKPDKTISAMQNAALLEWSPARIAQKNWDKQFGLTEIQAQSDMYWDGSEKFIHTVSSNFALQDALNATRKPDGSVDYQAAWQVIASTPGGLDTATAWYKAKYGKDPDFGINGTPTHAFMDWAAGEFAAAADNRLTNPFDATVHAISSSTALSPAEKSAFIAEFKRYTLDPNATPLEFTYNDQGEITGFRDPSAAGANGGNIKDISGLKTFALNLPNQQFTEKSIINGVSPSNLQDATINVPITAKHKKATAGWDAGATAPTGHYKIANITMGGIKYIYMLNDNGDVFIVPGTQTQNTAPVYRNPNEGIPGA
jgi:hypothetical protein